MWSKLPKVLRGHRVPDERPCEDRDLLPESIGWWQAWTQRERERGGFRDTVGDGAPIGLEETRGHSHWRKSELWALGPSSEHGLS